MRVRAVGLGGAGPNVSVTGVDFSTVAIAWARDEASVRGMDIVSVRCARQGESVRSIDGLPARRFRSPDLLVEELETAGLRIAASSIRDRGDQVHAEFWTLG